MKKTSLSIIVMAILSSFSSSMAQSYVKGYVVLTSYDTLQGYIYDRDFLQTMRDVKFKKELTDEGFDQYEPYQLIGFHLDEYDEYFVSKTVGVDIKPIQNNSLQRDDRNPKITVYTVFLKKLVEGKANLYYYRDPIVRKKHFFFDLNDNEPKELLLVRYYYTAQSSVVTSEIYKEQLKQTMKDCIGNDYKTVDYTELSLINLFKKYNECLNSPITYFFNNKSKTKVVPYFLGGISVASCDYKGLDNSGNFIADDMKYNQSVSPVLGIGTELKSNRNNPFSAGFELLFKRHSFSDETFIGGTTKMVKIGLSISQFNFFLKYIFHKRSNSFFRVGWSCAYLHAFENRLKNANNSSIYYDGTVASFAKINYGLYGSVGTSLKKFTFEARFDYMKFARQNANIGALIMKSPSVVVSYSF